MSKINLAIFKMYDIRGIYPVDIDEELAEKIGIAFACLLKEENPNKKLKIGIARDIRVSSPSLHKAIVKGVISQGCDVIDLSLLSTPTFYFAIEHYGYDGGIIVTASHNPKEYNGFKFTRKHVVPVAGDSGIDKIREMIFSEKKFLPLPVKEIGQIFVNNSAGENEISYYLKNFDFKKIKPFKIVFDPANGMGIQYFETFLPYLPIEAIKINFTLDGSFPNHEADPLKEENLEQIKKTVLETGADFGVATDGDGDRISLIDNQGKTIDPAILRGILAQIMLRKNSGGTVCYDIRPGKITRDLIEEAGGKPIVTKVGHSLIKERAREVKACFAGESSGHYFFWYNQGFFESPIMVILMFLQELSEKNISVFEWINFFRRYFHSGEINSLVQDKEKKLVDLQKKYSNGAVDLLDGITVEYSDWWFNVRPSNTEDKLRLNLEAKTKELMIEKRAELLKFIRE